MRTHGEAPVPRRLYPDCLVPTSYGPLLGKQVVWGADRNQVGHERGQGKQQGITVAKGRAVETCEVGVVQAGLEAKARENGVKVGGSFLACRRRAWIGHRGWGVASDWYR